MIDAKLPTRTFRIEKKLLAGSDYDLCSDGRASVNPSTAMQEHGFRKVGEALKSLVEDGFAQDHRSFRVIRVDLIEDRNVDNG